MASNTLARAQTVRLSMTLDLKAALRGALAYLVQEKSHCVILIGGAGSLGKSTLAVRLAECIRTSGRSVSVLDLDCYLIPRELREAQEPIVSGYNPKGYQLTQAVGDIQRLLSGHAVWVSPYDKANSTKAAEVEIPAGDVLVVEGALALREPIRTFGTIGVFFDAPPDVLYENRRERELLLGFGPERIERKFAGLRTDYELYIREQIEHAHIVALVGADYGFTGLTFRNAV